MSTSSGVVITTNHKTDGIYLPADDRRHFVAGTEITRDDFPADFWRNSGAGTPRGGLADVVAYLATYDLSNFDPKRRRARPKRSGTWSTAGRRRKCPSWPTPLMGWAVSCWR